MLEYSEDNGVKIKDLHFDSSGNYGKGTARDRALNQSADQRKWRALELSKNTSLGKDVPSTNPDIRKRAGPQQDDRIGKPGSYQ